MENKNTKLNFNSIIANATKLVSFKPEPEYNRYGQRTFIYCFDYLPKQYVVEKLDTLYFVNDRQGFFKSNKESIVNCCKESNINDWDTGLEESDFILHTSDEPLAVGSRIAINVDGDIEIYKITGFKTSDVLVNFTDIE